MERIGLVTFSTTYDNYGQVLQALATQEYLKRRGHEVVLLREYVGFFPQLVLALKKIAKQLLFFFTRSAKLRQWLKSEKEIDHWWARCKKNEEQHPRKIEVFRQQHFQIEQSRPSTLRRLRLSALCAGSDQIWENDSAFYHLAFGRPSLKRFAFAPSTGGGLLSKKGKMRVKEMLSSFSFVTTREESGVRRCQELGVNNAETALDPTLLLTSADYQHYQLEKTVSDDYILVYMLLGQSTATYADIIKFSEQHGLDVKYVTGNGLTDEHEKIYPSVGEWLSLVNHAKYVITNSFHGMSFSGTCWPLGGAWFQCRYGGV